MKESISSKLSRIDSSDIERKRDLCAIAEEDETSLKLVEILYISIVFFDITNLLSNN